MGYSFGGLIALEVLKLLEKNNRKGKLWLIDSAPQFLKMTAQLSFGGENVQDNEIQVQLLIRFIDFIWPFNKTEVSILKYLMYCFFREIALNIFNKTIACMLYFS